MSWTTLAVETDADHAEALSDALLDLGALSVDIHDAAAGTEQEQLLVGEPEQPSVRIWSKTEITATFNSDVDVFAVMKVAAQVAQLSSFPNYRLAQVEEQNWVQLTQSQSGPIKISSRLWIVPSWHQIPDPAAINLIIDPGLAFGTGSHPTTQLCLAWLDKNLQEGEFVLDFGCGSGILAIAALKLGADHVTGLDIDPQAIKVSQDNATRNLCTQKRIEFYKTSLEIQKKFLGEKCFDVVIANILAGPLIISAPAIAHTLRKNGHIVLSGILKEQAEEELNAYQQWFEMRTKGEQDGWVLLTGIKR